MSERRECGQNAGRQERIDQYSRWSGATPVGEDGQVKQADDIANPSIVEEELRAIRFTLKMGASIRVDIFDPKIMEAVKEQLTPEEREKVTFGDEVDHHTAQQGG